MYLYRLALAAVLQGIPGPDFTPSELIGWILCVTPSELADLVLLLWAPADTWRIKKKFSIRNHYSNNIQRTIILFVTFFISISALLIHSYAIRVCLQREMKCQQNKKQKKTSMTTVNMWASQKKKKWRYWSFTITVMNSGRERDKFLLLFKTTAIKCDKNLSRENETPAPSRIYVSRGSGSPDGFVLSWNQGSYQVLLDREWWSRSMTIKDGHYLVHNTGGCLSEGWFDMLI